MQETHSDVKNEVDWRRWWRSECVLSHGINAGVIILFPSSSKVKILSKKEIEPGRLLALRAEANGFSVVFVNIYAPNTGDDMINNFNKLKVFLRQQQNGDFMILRGDWNCTQDSCLDRNGEEPHMQSSEVLINVAETSDIWREKKSFSKTIYLGKGE